MDLLTLITTELTTIKLHSLILYYLSFASGVLINIVLIILLIKLIIWLIFGKAIKNHKAKKNTENLLGKK